MNTYLAKKSLRVHLGYTFHELGFTFLPVEGLPFKIAHPHGQVEGDGRASSHFSSEDGSLAF